MAYLGRRPYDVVMEPDPDQSGHVLMVFYSLGPPDAVLNAEVGAIINSLRTSLDLLFTALIERNGMVVDRSTYFPVTPDSSNFLGTIEKHEAEHRLSKAEATAIKNMRPYKGGNDTIYLLHHLDLKRKHRKLIEIRPRPGSIHLPMHLPNTAVQRPATPAQAAAPPVRATGPDQAAIDHLLAKAATAANPAHHDLARPTDADLAQLEADTHAVLADITPPAQDTGARLQAEIASRAATATQLAA
jgi:hypothetical protein